MKPKIIRQGGKLTEARLAEVEKKFGIRLPEDYRAFMLENNGGEPEPYGVCRKRRKTASLTCRYLFSIDAERSYEDWIPMCEGMKDEDEPTSPKRLVPIGEDNGNFFFISVSGKDAGKVYWWFHEDAVLPGRPRRVVLVADSFEKFLNQFAEFPEEGPKPEDWVRLVKNKDLNGVSAWLDQGGNWDDGDAMSGRTPLMLAIEMGDWPIVKLLVDRGASEQEALAHAIRIKAWAIVRSLLQRGIKETVKVDAAMLAGTLEDCNDVSIVKSLLDAGAPIHGEHYGMNPLYSATMCGGNYQIVKLLLERGAKLEQSSGKCPSALANAIDHGQFETVKLLLDAGQDLYKAPENKTRKEIKLEGQIRDEESKPKPNQKLIENYTYFLEFERKNNKPRAPIYSLEHPCRKHPPNFKKDVIAYAARLGQKPAAT